jgi:hypothetical protein
MVLKWYDLQVSKKFEIEIFYLLSTNINIHGYFLRNHVNPHYLNYREYQIYIIDGYDLTKDLTISLRNARLVCKMYNKFDPSKYKYPTIVTYGSWHLLEPKNSLYAVHTCRSILCVSVSTMA